MVFTLSLSSKSVNDALPSPPASNRWARPPLTFRAPSSTEKQSGVSSSDFQPVRSFPLKMETNPSPAVATDASTVKADARNLIIFFIPAIQGKQSAVAQ
jgi:hypothetical protein